MLITLRDIQLKRATDHERGNVQQFLDRLLVEVVSENYRYFLAQHLAQGLPPEDLPEAYCWPPLLSNERQVSGLFAIGLSRVCPISIPEHSITRASRSLTDNDAGSAKRKGRIDFLAYFSNRNIAIELKRCPISTLGEAREKTGLTNLWKTVESQSKEALVHMRSLRDGYDSPVSIGLMVVRVSRKVTARRELTQELSNAAKLLPEVAESVAKLTRADYISYYKAPTEMQASYGWGKSEDEYRVFPGVVFAAVVHESTKQAAAR
jgi:hypothetical protein